MNALARKLCVSLSSFRAFAFIIVIVCMATNCAYSQVGSDRVLPSGKVKTDRGDRTWHVGGFFVSGFPPNYEIHYGSLHYRTTLELYNAGFEAGRMLTALHGPAFLRGRGEAVVEVIPYWLAYYPKQEDAIYISPNETPFIGEMQSSSNHGISVTPLLFRWNFMNHESSRIVPWIQLGSGLLWTAHPFPQRGGPGYYTSRINFTPQIDFGQSIFIKKNQSLNMSVKVIHISSAGLGEYNPGVNASLQFSLGYSWWKGIARENGK